jgi:hypothetical protein
VIGDPMSVTLIDYDGNEGTARGRREDASDEVAPEMRPCRTWEEQCHQ